MRRILVLLIFTLTLSFTARTQELSWSTDGQLTYEQTDLDARVNYPVQDRNNKLCALIKVTVVNGKLDSPLILKVGTILEVVRREQKEDGEVWFYVPVEVKNLEFRCVGYKPIVVPVTTQLLPGGVYRITIASESSRAYAWDDPFKSNYLIKSNYLKVRMPEGTLFSIGSTRDYEITTKIISDGEFVMRLDYGEYYYKAENELYETAEGTLAVDDNSEVRTIEMTPAYSYLDIETVPGGAEVFVDGKSVGTSPVSLPDKMKRGSVSIRVQKEMYYTEEMTFDISGDALRHTATVTLSPQFGTVECRCEDPEAELWIDNQKVGTGTWTGQLSSLSSHYLEARRKGHMSRSLNFDIVEGSTVTQTIGAPEPLYGSIEVLSEPSGAVVKVDGKQVGTTPFILNEVLTEDHRIELSKDGYELYTAAFTLDYKQHLLLNYTLKKKEVKVAPPRHEVTASTQNLSMTSDGELTSDGKLTYVSNDLDAKVNFPVKDRNGKLCALIKVTVINELKNPLTLSVGSILEVFRTEYRNDGEVWFYIPTEVKNLEFRCMTYPSVKIPVTVRLTPGGVYRITITANSTGTYVETAVITANFLKLDVQPKGAVLYIGRTKEYEISTRILTDGTFNMRLDYGKYYYRLEREFYETIEGTLEVDSDGSTRYISMTPAYSYLNINTVPEGATVTIDGRYIGTSPVRMSSKMKKGEVTIRAQKDLYYPEEITFSVPGDTLLHTATINLKPQSLPVSDKE